MSVYGAGVKSNQLDNGERLGVASASTTTSDIGRTPQTPSASGQLTDEQNNAAVYLSRFWLECTRNEAAAALAGGLLRAGWPQVTTEAFVKAVATTANDDNVNDRVARVAQTAARLAKGEKVYGWPKLAVFLDPKGVKVVRSVRLMLGLTVNLEQLATAKTMPTEFLQNLGLQDMPDGGVGIPYKDGSGRTIAIKQRHNLVAKAGSYWPSGTKLMVYGEERLDEARAAGYQILTEGESDCWTLWFYGFPALGLPGSNTVDKTLEIGHVSCVPVCYVVQEPDGAGTEFVRRVSKRLAELGWPAELRIIRLEGAKDPNDLHKADPSTFVDCFRAAMAAAQPVRVEPLAAEPWPALLPLSDPPLALPFPLGVLPGSLQLFVHEAATALPCPADFVAVPLLVMAGVAVGASRALAIKAGHVQRPSLYAAVIGPPGSAKTPALDLTVEPTQEVEERLHATWELAMAQYEVELERYEIDLKNYKQNGGIRPEKPQRPILERLTVNDVTAEALVPILKENPRGVGLVRDELVGWVRVMNQYREGGKGADQQFFLSAWSGATVSVDRKKTHDSGPLRVLNPFISVVGGLTPDKLAELRGDRPRARVEQDGFIDRVLMSFPAEPPVASENWVEIADATRQRLREVLDKLRSLEMVGIQDEGGTTKGYRPLVSKLTADGQRAWQLFTERHAAERNADDFPSYLAGPWSKLRGYAARLALILHFLRWACGETECQDVDGESMERAEKLVTYFKSHARKVYAEMDADPRLAAAKRLVRIIMREKLSALTRRDAYRALRGSWKDLAEIDPILSVLETHGYLRPVQTPSNRPGRKPSLAYEVHPSILKHSGQHATGDGATNTSAKSVAESVRGSGADITAEEAEAGDSELTGSDNDSSVQLDHCVHNPERELLNTSGSEARGGNGLSLEPPGHNGQIGQYAAGQESATNTPGSSVHSVRCVQGPREDSYGAREEENLEPAIPDDGSSVHDIDGKITNTRLSEAGGDGDGVPPRPLGLNGYIGQNAA
jgi:hypothetical protein